MGRAQHLPIHDAHNVFLGTLRYGAVGLTDVLVRLPGQRSRRPSSYGTEGVGGRRRTFSASCCVTGRQRTATRRLAS